MNIDRFTDYFRKKFKFNLHLNKRLKAIEDYFENEHSETISFKNSNDCYLYIVDFINKNTGEAEEILEQIYYVLEYSFSSQNPYYICIFESTETAATLAKNIRRMFRKEVVYGDFKYHLRGDVAFDSHEETVICELDFIEAAYDFITEDTRRKSLGTIKIAFDIKNQKFLSFLSSNEKSHRNILEYLSSQGYNLHPIYILKRAQTIKNKNFTDFSPTTLLIINLILKTLPGMGYRITLDSINFTNIDSRDIQRMTLNGTDLLTSKEVLQRIHNGDTVHTLKVSLSEIFERNGQQVLSSASFKIDLRGRLAFVFGDEDSDQEKNTEICIRIQNSLMELIYDENTIENGLKLITENLPKPTSLRELVSSIQTELLEIIDDETDRIKIQKYFVEKYANVTS